MTAPRVSCWAALLVCCITLVGCARPRETEDERIRRQAAEDTRQLRQDARQAGTVARQEARKAGQQARDIVAGVREGWHDGAPAPGSKGTSAHAGATLNVNTASVSELSGLPGISPTTARKIARGRPNHATDDLVTRRLLTEAQYDRIAGRLSVHGN
ncbi:MAG TPA: helix-hairpin-helix domain-containing protein [Acidobacteriaceae bacterium]